jgi:hypothetical protein
MNFNCRVAVRDRQTRDRRDQDRAQTDALPNSHAGIASHQGATLVVPNRALLGPAPTGENRSATAKVEATQRKPVASARVQSCPDAKHGITSNIERFRIDARPRRIIWLESANPDRHWAFLFGIPVEFRRRYGYHEDCTVVFYGSWSPVPGASVSRVDSAKHTGGRSPTFYFHR